MTLNNQFKILNTKNYYQYLKENSNWFKELNRSENNINEFMEYVKDKYSLRISDRLYNAMDGIEMIQNVLNVLK